MPLAAADEANHAADKRACMDILNLLGTGVHIVLNKCDLVKDEYGWNSW